MSNLPLPSISTRSAWFGVLFGLFFPTVVTWAYFVLAANYSSQVQQATYLVMKCLQFGFPLFWFFAIERQKVRLRRPAWQGVGWGITFGLAVLLVAGLLYGGFLRSVLLDSSAAEVMREKISRFAIDSAWKFAALALFYSILHSALEEYYWRWFVFGRMRRLTGPWVAILLSALGFTAHHVLVLASFFGWFSWWTLLLSLAITTGGIFWAWLYQRSGSLVGPWLSHLLIDAGIFFVGYEWMG